MDSYPFKRRKVEHGHDQTTGEYGFNEGENKEKPAMPKLVLPAHHAFGVHGAARQKLQHVHQSQKSSQAASTKIQARELLGTHVKSVVQPAPEAASIVLAIAVDNGQSIVSEMVVPMASKTIGVPGYGVLNVTDDGTMPAITASAANTPRNANTNPGSVVPPPAIAASQARDQALQTQQAIAKQLNVVPQAPSNPASPTAQAVTSPTSALPLQPSPASQSPLAVNTLESRSQQVLSSPPTPAPATPPPSASSPASYFSSSPASIPRSSTPYNQPPATTSQSGNPGNPGNPQLSASSNSTMTATISSSSNSLASSSLSSGSSDSDLTTSEPMTSGSSTDLLAASTSTTRSPIGFTTSTLSSQTLSPGSSSTRSTVTPTSLSSSTQSASTTALTLTSASTQSSSQSSSRPVSGDPSSTGIGAGGVGGSSSATAAASPTSSSGGGSGGSNTPPTSVLAGGIVGGVAGATILILMLILLFRWRRNKKRQQVSISPPIPQTLGPGGVPQPGNMTQRSSITTPFAAAGILGRLRPASAQTATTAESAPSERGFQKISGRKLPSVLASGGDGYGETAAIGPSTGPTPSGSAPSGPAPGVAAQGSSSMIGGPQSKNIVPGVGPFAGLAPALRPGSPPHSPSGSSFYRDSQGFYGGVVPESTTQAETDISSSPSTSPTYPAPLNVAGRSPQDHGGPSNRQPEVAITRPGPARTPVINQPGTVPIRTPSRAHQPPPRSPARGTPPPPNTMPLRDGLGRSHPSQDGSRGSRFREDTTPP